MVAPVRWCLFVMEKEIIVGIYKITSPSGNINIGQSWDIDKRWKQYKNLGCKGQRKLYHSLKFYGPENHIFEKWEILPNDCTQKQLDEREIYWIEFYKSQGFEMLNLKDGGKGGKHSEETKKLIGLKGKGKNVGRIISEETRNKISRAHKGRIISPEEKQMKLQKMKENGRVTFQGGHHTEESKKKISEASKKQLSSPEARKMLSERMKGRIPSQESTLKRIETRKKNKIPHTHKGIPRTEEVRKKISEAHKGKKLSEEHRLKIVKYKTGRKQSPETIAKRAETISKNPYRASEETRQKISEKAKGRKISKQEKERRKEYYKNYESPMKGIPRSQETRDKIRKGHIGKIMSEEARNNMRIAQTGRKASDETKRKMSETRKIIEQNKRNERETSKVI